MHIECVKTSEQLDRADLADGWNRLAAHSPFVSWDWQEAWWRHYRGRSANGGRPGELLTLVVRDASGRLVGLAPWYLDRSVWQGRVLRFLGTRGVCSDYLGMLAEPGLEKEMAAAVADWLTDQAAGQWDLLDLESVDADDHVTRELGIEMKSRCCYLNVRPGPSCWRLELPNDWEQYLGRLSRAQRKHVRRYERSTFDGGLAVLRTVEREEELPAALEILAELHQQRQLSLGNAGRFSSERFMQFHHEVTRRFLRRGLLRLHWLEMKGRAVAAEYDLAGARTIFSYQSGIDPRATDNSPGQLTTIATLKLAIEQGFAAYDFLRGDEPYKATWRATPRPSIRLRIVAAHASARMRHRVWVVARTLKNQLAGAFQASDRHS